MQDAASMGVAAERIDHNVATHTAGADAGYLVVEGDPLFRNQCLPPERIPSGLKIGRRLSDELAFAVASVFAGLLSLF